MVVAFFSISKDIPYFFILNFFSSTSDNIWIIFSTDKTFNRKPFSRVNLHTDNRKSKKIRLHKNRVVVSTEMKTKETKIRNEFFNTHTCTCKHLHRHFCFFVDVLVSRYWLIGINKKLYFDNIQKQKKKKKKV